MWVVKHYHEPFSHCTVHNEMSEVSWTNIRLFKIVGRNLATKYNPSPSVKALHYLIGYTSPYIVKVDINSIWTRGFQLLSPILIFIVNRSIKFELIHKIVHFLIATCYSNYMTSLNLSN